MSAEPCGSLPVTTFNVSAHYCEHHMAWTANYSVSRQSDEDDLLVIHSEHRSWGPFDTPDDVHAWLAARVWRVLDLPT